MRDDRFLHIVISKLLERRMAPILDGLLDAEEDLSILSLALQERRTHAVLTKQALVRPSSDKTPLLSLGNHSHARPPKHLYVPHIRLPWAHTLHDLLLARLNLRLIPPFSSTDVIVQAPAIVRTLLNHRPSQPSADWHHLVTTFYVPLSPSASSHNARILAQIRTVHPPHLLYRLANAARLAMTSALLSSLTRTPINTLDSPVTIIPSSLRGPRTRSAAVTIIARPISSRAGLSASRTLSMTSSDPDGSVLLHNSVLKKTLLPVVADILEKRYAVCVALPASNPLRLFRANRLAGSLASLANRGTALVNVRQHEHHDSMLTGRGWVGNKQSAWKSEFTLRGPNTHNLDNTRSDVDTYLREAHGTTWTSVLKWATREAMKSTIEARERERKRIRNVIEQIRQLRERLIEKAVSLEVAGAPLYKICAFTIVQKLDKSDVDCLEKRGFEYDLCLTHARQRMNSLGVVSNSSAQPSAHVVAALALP